MMYELCYEDSEYTHPELQGAAGISPIKPNKILGATPRELRVMNVFVGVERTPIFRNTGNRAKLTPTMGIELNETQQCG